MASAQHRREALAQVHRDLITLFGEQNSSRRGKALEKVLNRWFSAAGILVRDAYTVRGRKREGIIEQVDSMIELQGHFYLVEMKWHSERIGPREIASHLLRVLRRRDAGGIFIASAGYTEAAIACCREILGQITMALCDLEELRRLLEYGHDLTKFLRRKIEFAVADRDPYHRILCTPTAAP